MPNVNDTKLKPWLRRRTPLEMCLLIACVGLSAAVVTLAFLLRPAHAPLETDWGNAAEWTGVVVTFFGFVGAFGALMLQHRGVEDQQRSTAIHAEQRREELEAREMEAAEEARADALIHASSFTIRAFATYVLETERSEIRLGCTANPIDASKFTDVKLVAPEHPELKEVRREGTGSRVSWRANWSTSDGTIFAGGDPRMAAESWLQNQCAVEFTIPTGERWRLDGRKVLKEITGEATTPLPNPE